MEHMEKKSPACFEPSTSKDRILVKEKPSPLRIIKRCRSRNGYSGKNPKDSCLPSCFDVSPINSPPGALMWSEDGTLKIPRRRPKTIIEEKYMNDAAPDSRRSSQRSSFGHSTVIMDNNDSINEQDKKHRTPSFFRYPVKFTTFRRKRHSDKGNFENANEDATLLRCIPLKEGSVRLYSSSRASSRCTNNDPKNTYCSMDSSLLSDSSLPEKPGLVLSPYIRVESETMGISKGQQHLWAAVEVSGRLSTASNEPETEPQTTPCLDQDTCLRFGYLYDLTVDILPTPKSSLLQITCQQQFPITMFAGSSVLLLVHVMCQLGIGSSSSLSFAPKQHKHIRQRSDELMEDLELQLGDSLMTYMSIRVSYSHSAFPSRSTSVGAVEMSSFHTKLSTTAEAAITPHNALCPWSPHPRPVKSQLFPLIEHHWGPQKASDAMRQMLAQRSALSPDHDRALREGYEQHMAREPLHHPYTPTISPRQTSLQGTQQMRVKSRPSSHPLSVKRVSHDWEVGSRGVSDGRIPERDGEDDKSGKGQGQKHGTTGDNGKKNASLWTWATWF
ncbi:hypothetical protein CI102_8586 [Trichoderma harzianum]|nr:hypothetical protein CI102_8586 [Trichoderma harzianum]